MGVLEAYTALGDMDRGIRWLKSKGRKRPFQLRLDQTPYTLLSPLPHPESVQSCL